MQNCSTYVIFIDSIKGETFANFVILYFFLQIFIPELFCFYILPMFFLAKFPRIISLLLFLHFEMDKKTNVLVVNLLDVYTIEYLI